jgi:hypothetical protein
MQMMQSDDTKFTRKRVMVTTRLPKFAVADPTMPWLMLEAEHGGGMTVALMGLDNHESRVDACKHDEAGRAGVGRCELVRLLPVRYEQFHQVRLQFGHVQ